MSYIDPPALFWGSAKEMDRSLAEYLWRETMKAIEDTARMEELALDIIRRHPHLADCVYDLGRQFTIVNLVGITEDEALEAYDGSR